MKIQKLSKPNKKFKDFQRQSWKHFKMEYFGTELEWLEEEIYLQVVKNGEIIGTLEAVMYPGVVRVKDLIVSFMCYRQGVGKKLMLAIEKIAKKHKVHKIYLTTGKDWSSVKFYQKLGYNVLMELKNHFYGDNSVYLVKNL